MYMHCALLGRQSSVHRCNVAKRLTSRVCSVEEWAYTDTLMLYTNNSSNEINYNFIHSSVSTHWHTELRGSENRKKR